MAKAGAPVHPGQVLSESYLKPMGVSANRLGAAIAVPANRISEIVKGRRSISADTALRLAELFGTDAEYWLKLQSDHDLAIAREQDGAEIRRVIDVLRSVAPLPAFPMAEEPAAADAAEQEEEEVDSA